eukprot:TRINITY_DN6249_c0_g2_i1.p1 TRINITY_DN6249_c0_g2~~TRINITY_DN6249_c0_g2_i1.p1  ORF type:complete len:562 (+),score=220.62 TRINITY_DN6249_c0_g2_i1:107-1792(+)
MPGKRGAKPGGKARVRTESMIDRLGKKPLSDGFDLWDKDYILGALRLFQCKLEVAPPFEVAACHDAVAEILCLIEETGEAATQFEEAAKKYSIINKGRLASLMTVKQAALEKSPADALADLETALASFDPKLEQDTPVEDLGVAKVELPQLGRQYLFRAELLMSLDRSGDALKHALSAVKLGTDRVHLAHLVRAQALGALGMNTDAAQACADAVAARPCFVMGYELMADCLRLEGKDAECAEALRKACEQHPKPTLIRDEAFAVSAQGDDAAALSLLEKHIADPPHEEGDDADESRAVLLKAKAAILADQEQWAKAVAALEAALKAVPGDDEAMAMLAQVKEVGGEAAAAAPAAPSDEDEAAQKIQAIQRGRKARQEAEAKKAKQREEEEARKKAAVAAEAAEESDAATKIQAIQRGRKARQEADAKKAAKETKPKPSKDQVNESPAGSPSAQKGAVVECPGSPEEGVILRVGPDAGSPTVHDVSGVAHTDPDLRRIFDEIDRNKNGWLDPEELTKYYVGLDHFGMDPDPGFIDRQLRQFGGDGKVTFDEFAVIMLRIAAR